MPWSWVRVPIGTSPALSTCVAAHEAPTRQDYAVCIGAIVDARRDGNGPIDVKFEANGKWAHVLFEWANHIEKHRIMFALHASDGIDVLTAEEVDLLEEQENKPTT